MKLKLWVYYYQLFFIGKCANQQFSSPVSGMKKLSVRPMYYFDEDGPSAFWLPPGLNCPHWLVFCAKRNLFNRLQGLNIIKVAKCTGASFERFKTHTRILAKKEVKRNRIFYKQTSFVNPPLELEWHVVSTTFIVVNHRCFRQLCPNRISLTWKKNFHLSSSGFPFITELLVSFV